MERSISSGTEAQGKYPEMNSQPTARTNLPLVWMTHLESGPSSPSKPPQPMKCGAEMYFLSKPSPKCRFMSKIEYCSKPLGFGVVCYAAIDTFLGITCLSSQNPKLQSHRWCLPWWNFPKFCQQVASGEEEYKEYIYNLPLISSFTCKSLILLEYILV